jgi:haloalkane dehalogenase
LRSQEFSATNGNHSKERELTERDTAILDSSIHHVETGEGDPIVFLHGNPTSSVLWRNVIPRFAGEGRAIAPDLIGMGRSGKPDIAYRFADHARYLDAWFDALALSRVTLVVHDWGSALGIDWARRHADRVAGVAMMEAILRDIPWNEFPSEIAGVFRSFRTSGVGEKLVLEDNVFIERILPGAILRKLRAEEMDAYRAPYPTAASRRPILAWPRQLPLGGEPPEIIAMLRENERWLSSSTTPKLLLRFDPGVLVTERVAEWCARTFRNLEVQRLGPGLHYVQEDHPEAIGDAARDWRRRVIRP